MHHLAKLAAAAITATGLSLSMAPAATAGGDHDHHHHDHDHDPYVNIFRYGLLAYGGHVAYLKLAIDCDDDAKKAYLKVWLSQDGDHHDDGHHSRYKDDGAEGSTVVRVDCDDSYVIVKVHADDHDKFERGYAKASALLVTFDHHWDKDYDFDREAVKLIKH